MRRILFVSFLGIIGILIVVALNYFFPLNFSVYFLVCILSLLLCKFVDREHKLLLPWIITATASILVTLNYLHPDISVYNNSDYHVLVMQGVDQKDSILLVGRKKAKSLFDSKQMEGRASISRPQLDGAGCVLRYDMPGEPLFATVDNSRTGRLVNKDQMPSFRNMLQISNDSMQCDISIQEFGKDSVHVNVTLKHLMDNHSKEYLPSFKQPIRIGYNLFDLLHSGQSYGEGEEKLLSALRRSVLIRNYDDIDEGVYYLTFTHAMEPLKIVCDGQPFKPMRRLQSVELDKDTYYYIGIGNQATRPMKASYQDGVVCLRYRFPYINNFPRVLDRTGLKENGLKNLAVTTKTSSLLSTSVKEAFYYPLFDQDDNEYHFNGCISYRVNDSQTPFTADLTDDGATKSQQPNTLTAKNGAVWHFNVCNLRQASPVTGMDNVYVKDTTIIGFVLVMLLLAFIYSMVFVRGHVSKIVMTACLFAVPLFVMRIYLLWRIAVFPPVADITLNEFLRYRMELPGIWTNPVIISAALWLAAPVAALLTWLTLKPLSKYKRGGIWYHILGLAFPILAVAVAVSFRLAHVSIVGMNILVPVTLFLVNEYIISRGLPVGYRIGNALAALLALFVSDPGYAIMFFIFECIYYSILLYSYLKYRWWEYSSGKKAGFYLFLALMLVILAIVICLPNLVWYSYSHELIFSGIITTSRAFFIILPLLIGGTILMVTWHWQQLKLAWNWEQLKDKWGGNLGIVLLLAFVMLTSTYGYDYFQNNNLHFKYRAIIHTKMVGDIMKGEKYDHDNSQRLLNAAQNQWFLQYHINKGGERVSDDGIMSLLPHFKKGVTWNTQISDVVLSRYVIGELSGLVPVMMIILSLVLLWMVFRSENYSPAGRVITFAVALLFVVQSTFEWMAVTNRTVFLGQDFPFLSQNARSTLIMFVFWIVFLIVFACHQPKREDNEDLGEGLNAFTERLPLTVFFALFAVTSIAIFLWGNNYEDLYAGSKAEGDRSNAEEFNISTAMKDSKDQLKLINARLSEYPETDRKLENDEDITSLVNDINEKIHLKEYVDKLKGDGLVNDFTYSLYQAFESNLMRKNSNHNIIHLRHHNAESYELALNDSYFSLQSPDYDKKAWKGNVYSDVSSSISEQAVFIKVLPGVSVYSVPRSWLPSDIDYAIVDCRNKDGHVGENYKKIIHREMADYAVSSAVFPISPSDILELNDKKKNDVLTYQYGREEQNLLVKNMIINGKRKFFYPLREKCLWLREFSEMVAYSKQGSGSKDSIFVTLDTKLTESISGILRKTNHECSVVAMDGRGNVRLIADNKLSGAIDPNDEELINELAVQSYMNPNPETDQSLFGNLNLCYMNPGPGSSLKPITYAAVTSQSLGFKWSSLELMSPAHTNDSTVVKVVGKHYHARKFGPQYKYTAERPFVSITDDEKGVGETGWINNHYYLYKSSNYYNALVTYLGHYDDLSDAENTVFVISSSQNDFPRFRIEKDGKVYTFRDAPQHKTDQLLFEGLTKNFKVPTVIGYVDTLRHEFVSPTYYRKNNIENKVIVGRYSWVFPQASSIYDYEMTSSVLMPAERLRQYTLGSAPVKVTPVKMAEMYGKLYSLHPDFHASVTPRITDFTQPWLDRSGNTSDNFLGFYQKNLYKGMEECVRIGTASNLTKDTGDYYLYAKTGTLSLRKGVNDDRMLAVIISNRNLVADGQIKSSNDYKFMVVYFRFKQLDPKSELFWPTVNSVVKEIVNSTSFINYMK